MKVILFFMLCVALVYAKSASLCPADGGHMLIPHEFCNRFYLCNSGHRFELSCPYGLMFDPEHQMCTWADLISCDGRIVP
ncbi:hypothetical protein SFRURICE_009327 [Spodoptera frugiperda]|nr:hypothetical protein SFRURICE_009327 [Spodoptera frugiperda]